MRVLTVGEVKKLISELIQNYVIVDLESGKVVEHKDFIIKTIKRIKHAREE